MRGGVGAVARALPLALPMSLDDNSPLDVASDRKRLHVDMESAPEVEENGIVEVEMGVQEVEQGLEPMEPPPAKRPKVGRKPLPEEECEHGRTTKTCQKCIYRNRVERAIVKHDQKGTIMKVVLMWSQNVVFFGSLASVLVLPQKDMAGTNRVIEAVDSRVAQFHHYRTTEMKKLKDVKDAVVEESVASAFDMMNLASPASVETVFAAKWLLEREYKNEGGLAALIGEPSFAFTQKLAALWEDDMVCGGISDPAFVEHFKFWKGSVWKNRDGVYGVRLPGDSVVRSVHCTGFTAEGLCDRCSTVRRHLMKERSAYKADPPGIQLLLKSLPPGYREIVNRLKLLPPQDPALLGPSEELDETEFDFTDDQPPEES